MTNTTDLREALATATPGPLSVETQLLENVEEGDEPAVYVCHPDTICDVTVFATMGTSIIIPLGQKQADAALIVAAINALPSLLDELDTLRQRLKDAEAGQAVLREALERMVYETTHLSACKPNGDHDCTVKADALAKARKALHPDTPK